MCIRDRIGDDLEKIIKKSGFSKNYVIVETTGFVNDMYTGFQNVIIDILEKALNNRKIARNDKSRSGTVSYTHLDVYKRQI